MQKTKRYLKQAYRLNELIQCDKQELEELKLLSVSLGGIDYSKDKVQVSPSNDASYTKIVAKIVELENMIKSDIERMLILKAEIREVINSVPDKEEQLVLRCRYLNFYSWEKIYLLLNVSARTVHRIHNNALRNVKNSKFSARWHTLTH